MGYQLQVGNRATQDLRQHANYILSQGNTAAAIRFLEAAEQTFEQLSDNPNVGKVVAIADKKLGNVRQWRIRHFKIYLIFYLVDSKTVDILRVLHGSRDLGNIVKYLGE